jgi:hypothetical protein
MSLVNVCCQVEGFATGLSLIQRRRTEYGVSECVCVVSKWQHWGGLAPSRAVGGRGGGR